MDKVCEVMLYAYMQLEHRCEIIDKDIYRTAVHSAFKDTMGVVKDIERLTAEKIAYINVKVIIEKATARLKHSYELKQHHFNGLKIEQIATTLGGNIKTIACRIRRQREKLYKEILKEYSAEELLNIISDSQWLMRRYRSALNGAKMGGTFKAVE